MSQKKLFNEDYSKDRIPCDGCGRYVTDEDWDAAGDGRRLCSECEYRETHDDREEHDDD